MLQSSQRSLTIPRLSLPWALAIALVIFAACAGLLVWMGHVPICKCGYVKLWHGHRADSQTSQHLTDWYTYSHVLHGIIFYWILTVVSRGHLSVAARLVIAAMIEGTWEVLENTPFVIERYRAQTLARDYFGDSVINSVADMLAMLVGFLLAARLPAWVTVALVITVELVLLWLIRDNLALNILMLLYPIDAIKQWQLGG
jgi:hypothetical protein